MNNLKQKVNQKAKLYSKDFCIHNKPRTQAKFRNRVKTSMNKQYSERNDKNKNTNRFSCKTEPRQEQYSQFLNKCQNKFQDDFTKTSSKLCALNFNHHHPSLCVCAQCTCGRHLCQFHGIRPGFTKNTVYKKDYMKKKPIENRININGQYDRLKGPILDLDSIYIKQFKGKTSEIERPKPQDLLKSGGPCLSLTSYTSGFPGHKGDNQYIKPTDNCTRGEYPFRSKSTYSNTFIGFPGKRSQFCKTPDNLKTGSNWYGTTTYSNNFKQPNPEDYAKLYKMRQKLQTNPDFSHQFETMYKKQFVGHQTGMCPAKVIIQTKAKGFFASSKNKFAQNTDFRSLDPNFRTMSKV